MKPAHAIFFGCLILCLYACKKLDEADNGSIVGRWGIVSVASYTGVGLGNHASALPTLDGYPLSNLLATTPTNAKFLKIQSLTPWVVPFRPTSKKRFCNPRLPA